MTHAEYLERHHELSNQGLTVIAFKLGQQQYEEATTATTNLRTMLDDLWEQRRLAAGREVAP